MFRRKRLDIDSPGLRGRLARAIVRAAFVLPDFGSSGGGVPGGDKGNKRLHQLAADPIFTLVPAGANAEPLKLTPARYRKPGFTGGGWDGPLVALQFTSAADPRAVYEFYAREAQAAGWTATSSRNAMRLPFGWTKTYPNGNTAMLGLDGYDPRDSTPGLREYRLHGSI